MANPPLNGVRVLDFSHALAGPYCSLLLAHYGASVYKLETPEGGDIGRGWGPPFTGENASFFLGLNCGKRSISVNLKSDQGRELALQMMEKADVVLENFRPGTLQKLGLGYQQARARNPRLIYCSISGYGQNGPARDFPAMDLILQASTGLISMTGTMAGEQVRCGHSVADVTAGMFALIGILMALHSRTQSGAGQFVDVSMFDSMISAMASVFANYLGSGNVPRPLGTTFSTIVPYRTFPTKDREVAMAVGSEKLWATFCRAIGHPELIDHPDYRTNALRVKNRGVLEPMLAEIFRSEDADHWFHKLNAAGVPCSPVRTIDEVVSDPQSAVRQLFPQLPDVAGKTLATGLPVKFSETPGEMRKGPPMLGQHTRDILTELLGLTPAALDELESAGAIRSLLPQTTTAS
ncbi:MAG: CoA transferase [Acidobacteriia bacterium]|nr:CoA transferase [Terriglobia bacterium]